MAVLLILRTVTGQVLRQPLMWLSSAVLVAAWWGLEVFMPLGLSTDQLHRSTAHYELAFLGGALGQAMALPYCLKLRWAFSTRGAIWGVAVDLVVLSSIAALVASAILIPAEVFQRWQFAEFQTARSLGALGIGWLHLAAMASVIPLRSIQGDPRESFRDKLTGVGWIAFAVAVVPALAAGRSLHGRALLHILDPGRMLQATYADADLGTTAWLAAILPILGWSLVAVGLSHRSTRGRPIPSTIPPDALRHTR